MHVRRPCRCAGWILKEDLLDFPDTESRSRERADGVIVLLESRIKAFVQNLAGMTPASFLPFTISVNPSSRNVPEWIAAMLGSTPEALAMDFDGS